jgi:hypothetical protein
VLNAHFNDDDSVMGFEAADFLNGSGPAYKETLSNAGDDEVNDDAASPYGGCFLCSKSRRTGVKLGFNGMYSTKRSKQFGYWSAYAS